MPRDCNNFRIQIILKFESAVLILAKKSAESWQELGILEKRHISGIDKNKKEKIIFSNIIKKQKQSKFNEEF